MSMGRLEDRRARGRLTRADLPRSRLGYECCRGAAGVLIGGDAAIAAVMLTVLGPSLEGWPETLTTQSVAWTVPLAVIVMVAVSIATGRSHPGRRRRHHAPPAPRYAAAVTARRWGQGRQLLRSWNECG
jgi:hypothetical protein